LPRARVPYTEDGPIVKQQANTAAISGSVEMLRYTVYRVAVAHERNDGAEVVGRVALKPLERPVPLTEQAYERIRAELLAGGRLSHAQRLVERDVARKLSMSRTPVRDALRRLAAEGLIEPLPGGGYARRRLTDRDVRECYELRLLLEPVAAGLAARRAAASSNRPQGGSGASEPYERAGFHAWVAEQSGNPVLAQVLQAVSARLLVGEVSGILDDAPAAHEAIAAAIRSGDADAASEEMALHLRSELERWRMQTREREVGERS
jgi:DNA-binding GntR family transcriptional regulator